MRASRARAPSTFRGREDVVRRKDGGLAGAGARAAEGRAAGRGPCALPFPRAAVEEAPPPAGARPGLSTDNEEPRTTGASPRFTALPGAAVEEAPPPAGPPPGPSPEHRGARTARRSPPFPALQLPS